MTISVALNPFVLPEWAKVSDKRRKHIARVTTLLMQWADEIGVSDDERRDWMHAGLLHDALRDADEAELRGLAQDPVREEELLHGPAVANLLASSGNVSAPALLAIRYHTVGSPDWNRTGKALYMADFLEPGRPFLQADRAFLAAHATTDFDGVFRQVVRTRIEWTVREGKMLFPETADLWNSVR